MKLIHILARAVFLNAALILYSYSSAITFTNSMNVPATIHINKHTKIVVPKGHTKQVSLDSHSHYFILCVEQNAYRISYQSPSSEHLDIKTMLWLAQQEHSSIGYDQIKVHNDMLYTIAVLWKLKQTRTRAQMVEPQETVSKVVREEEPSKSQTANGELLLSLLNPNAAKYIFPFKRRVIKEHDNVWHEVTLSANTLIAFYNGKFTIE